MNAMHELMVDSRPVVHGHRLESLNLPMIQSGKHLGNFSGQRRCNYNTYKANHRTNKRINMVY